jgi:hypothetical protein
MKKSYRQEQDGEYALELFYNSQIPTGRKFKRVENIADESLRTKETITIRDNKTGVLTTYVLDLLL